MKLTLTPALSYCQIGHRSNQEDSRYPNMDHMPQGQRCFVVCDGVGGSECGEVASSVVAQTLGDFLDRTIVDADTPFTNSQLQEAFNTAWEALDRQNRRKPADMATTVALAVFHSGGLTVAHMGDSRIYVIRPTDHVIYRSDDHTIVNAMVHNGMLTPEQALSHPQRNVITRYMAPTEDDQLRSMATVNTITDVRAGDYVLLCSDGVTDVLSDDQLLAIVGNPALSDEQKITELAARTVDSPDNNTAVLVAVADVTPTPVEPTHSTSDTDTNPINNPEPGVTDIHTTMLKPRKRGFFGRLCSLFKK